jgi:hypothetical protein
MSVQTSGTQYPLAPDEVVHPLPDDPPFSGPPVQRTSCAHVVVAASSVLRVFSGATLLHAATPANTTNPTAPQLIDFFISVVSSQG